MFTEFCGTNYIHCRGLTMVFDIEANPISKDLFEQVFSKIQNNQTNDQLILVPHSQVKY